MEEWMTALRQMAQSQGTVMALPAKRKKAKACAFSLCVCVHKHSIFVHVQVICRN